MTGPRVDWRARFIDFMQEHGGELKTTPARNPYGVNNILKKKLKYTGGSGSWATLMRRMEEEGIYSTVDRDAKRVWHIRLCSNIAFKEGDEGDPLPPRRGPGRPRKNPLPAPPEDKAEDKYDYVKLGQGVLEAALKAIAKPGAREVRLKAELKQLRDELDAERADHERTKRELAEERSAYKIYREKYRMPDNVDQILDVIASELPPKR